jgi:hypothetical protein
MPGSKIYSRSSAATSGHVGRTGPTRDKGGAGSSVKSRLGGAGVNQGVNTGKGSAGKSRLPAKGGPISRGATAQAGPTFRSHGHAALQAKTRATGQRKGRVKTVRPARGAPGPI